MTISFKQIVPDAFAVVVDGEESSANFRKLIQRAANLWPDAPAEIKEFADEVTTGRIQQDYRAQSNQPMTLRVSSACLCGYTNTRDIKRGDLVAHMQCASCRSKYVIQISKEGVVK